MFDLFDFGHTAAIRRIRRWLASHAYHNVPITTIRHHYSLHSSSRTTVANVRCALEYEGYEIVNGRATKPRGTKRE